MTGAFQPAGFPRPVIWGHRVGMYPLRRGFTGIYRNRGIGIRRNRGLGDAAADSANYTAMAAGVAPSPLRDIILACAANPTPTCATASQSWFNAGYVTPQQQQQFNQAIASGSPIPQMQFSTGPPPGTYLPTAAPVVVTAGSSKTDTVSPTQGVTVSPASNAPSAASQPVQAVQPAGATQPTDNSQSPPPSGFLSQTILGFPLWVWGLAGLAGYFVFSGGSHGR